MSDVVAVQVCGESAGCAHRANAVIHIVNAVLLGLVLRVWFASDGLALLLAGIFLLHPLNSEAVSYVAGRSDLLLAFWAVLGLFACVPSPSWRQWIALIGASLGAMLTKELGVMVPVLFLLTIAYRRQWQMPRWALLLVPVLAVADGLMVWHSITHWPVPGVQHPLPGLMSMQSAAVWRYIAEFFLIAPLSADHDWALVPHGVAIVALAGLLLLAWCTWRCRARAPLVTFGICWLLVSLAPRFLIPTEGEYLAERQFYLPAIGLLLAVTGVVRLLSHRWARLCAEWDAYMAMTAHAHAYHPEGERHG